MSKFCLEMDLKELINKMPVRRKIELIRELEKETLPERLDNVANKIRRQIKHIPSQKEIDRICKKVRKRIYEKYKGR